MATSARLASAVGSANGRPGSRVTLDFLQKKKALCLAEINPQSTEASVPTARTEVPAAAPSRAPHRPARRAPAAAPSTPATPIRPGTSRRTCRRRWTRRRSTPPAAPSARRATPPAGRTRAARLPPLRRTASRLLPAAAGQHASLPSGAPHRDFSLRLLVRRPFSLVSLPRFSLILLPPVLSQAGSTLLWPRNRRQLARDEFAPLSTN